MRLIVASTKKQFNGVLYLTGLIFKGPIPPFLVFSSFSHYSFNNTNWKNCRWCAWDSKQWLQDGRRRWYNGAMVAPQGLIFRWQTAFPNNVLKFLFMYKLDRFIVKQNIFFVIKSVNLLQVYMCETCGKKFQTDKTLEVHHRVVHLNQKPFSCKLCDYKAGQKASLIAHNHSVHEGNKPYVCESCGYKTTSQSTLNAHKRMVSHGHSLSLAATVWDRLQKDWFWRKFNLFWLVLRDLIFLLK